MSKSLIQVANTNAQTLAVDDTIALGRTIRRFGCNLMQNGDSITANGTGYFTITGAVTIAPEAIGDVSIAAFENGVQIPGTVSTGSVSTAGNSVTLPIVTTIRKGCCCTDDSVITLGLLAGAGAVSNVSLRVEKA